MTKEKISEYSYKTDKSDYEKYYIEQSSDFVILRLHGHQLVFKRHNESLFVLEYVENFEHIRLGKC